MLRINVIDEPHSTTVIAEGKLVGEWVAEARRLWMTVALKSGVRKKIVDLYGVTFVDESGRGLLSEMHADGAKLVGSGPMISALIEDIQGPESRPKPRRTGKALLFFFGLLLLLAVTAERSLSQEINPPQCSQGTK